MRNGIAIVNNTILDDGSIGRISLIVTVISTAAAAAAHHSVNNGAVDGYPSHLLPSLESSCDAAGSEEKDPDEEGNDFEE